MVSKPNMLEFGFLADRDSPDQTLLLPQCHDAVLIGYTSVLPDMDLVGSTRPYLTRIS